jgi:exopolysaccharide biosynthesis polyprenyl glycosylphosphotransferase
MFNSELRRQKTLLAAGDAASLAACVTTSAVADDYYHGIYCLLCETNPVMLAALAAVVCIVWIFAARAFGLYVSGTRRGEQFLAIIKASVITLFIVLTLVFLAHQEVPRLSAGVAFVLSLGLVPAVRGLVQMVIAIAHANPKVTVPLAIVGCNDTSRYVCDQMLEVFTQYDVVGFISPDGATGDDYLGRPLLGGLEAIPELAARYRNLEVAIILPDFPRDVIEKAVRMCESHNVRWCLMPAQLGWTGSRLSIEMIGVVPLMGTPCPNLEGLNFVLKRMFDLIVASIALVIASPVMLLSACAIWLTDGRPLVFRQSRMGIHGQPFELLKFRTMRVAENHDVHRNYVRSWIKSDEPSREQPNSAKVFKLTSDPRVTPVGKWLRRFSIDELPQFINVLRGDMSLVGPRPALSYELDLYQDWHRRRLAALPGITGLWQVSGRNQLSFDQMVKLDIKYIEQWSLGEDLRILFRTVPALFGGGH